MFLDLCLLASDLNPTYYEFFPLVYHYWTVKIGIACKLVLIVDDNFTVLPDVLLPFENDIIVFRRVADIPTGFQAQCIRILYPALLVQYNAIILSDMDILPLQKEYFVEKITKYDENSFVVYRNVIKEYKQYPICYCVASPSTYRYIFNIDNENDIKTTLKNWYTTNDYLISSPHSTMWCQDQVKLFEYIQNKRKTLQLVELNDFTTKFRRLDRLIIDDISKNIARYNEELNKNVYTDFHLPRPLTQFVELFKNLGL